MLTYQAPLDDLQFIVEEVLDAPASWRALPAFADLDAATARAVLEEAGRFAGELLAPTNGPGDLAGCRLDADGGVRTPPGFREAYRAYVDGGWPALACDPAWGGQGLPQLLNVALHEMLSAANHAWQMYPGLAHGAYECLKAHGTPALRERYLGPIVSGEWLASMALTEPHAGSDLGLLRTKAVPVGEAANGCELRVSGEKIFISGGEHDLTDNIVHLVLCRLPGAPAGSKGLSLALVPKHLPDGAGLGARNAVRCTGLEKKMGIKGSATCALHFDGATGWLIGEPHRGLAAMFLMMNAARVQVAVQGLGHLEIARQNARRYAADRRQMRATLRPAGEAAATAPDPIAWHPAVRRTLWTLEALALGQRVLALWAGLLIDEAGEHPDPTHRAEAEAKAALLTPVLKAMLTDNGFQGASAALQLWGGHGYVHDHGIEQVLRDSRIAMLYEGTNEIQAIDLLQRKVLDDRGERLAALLATLDAEVQTASAWPDLVAPTTALRAQLQAWRGATTALIDGRGSDAEWPLRVAGDYLQGAGLTLLGWAWLRCLRVQSERAAGGPAAAPSEAGTAAASAHVAASASPPERAVEASSPTSRGEERGAAARFGFDWLLPAATLAWQRVHQRDALLPWIGA